jgi:Zn finger protein HypA/HybF involved in hydrogenase expression
MYKCPKCGSKDVNISDSYDEAYGSITCNDCGENTPEYTGPICPQCGGTDIEETDDQCYREGYHCRDCDYFWPE